jgi:hypothetical protein
MADIQVNGKTLVMQVLLDTAGNYSVSGYAERMERAFGLIYLGRDRTDPEYAAQSAASNAAIGAITEREAFDLARQEARAVMQPLAGEAAFGMKDVSNQVLAAICTHWFDIPDGDSVIGSGSFWPFKPGRCPGQFGPPSGYIFKPQPGFWIALFGKMDGRVLRSEVARFVARQRQAGTPPNGRISQALFAAFPNSPAQDDLLARTLIGVMMGFLPTAQGNLMAVAEAWAGGQFDALRAAFLAHPQPDLYLRANQVIRTPMIEAMQAQPMPPAVWRTALRDHLLGGSIQVRAGDRLFINIDSATREDHAVGNADALPIFGGDRSQHPHPTHACPGYQAGMGVLLGTIVGTMEAGPTLSSGWSIF